MTNPFLHPFNNCHWNIILPHPYVALAADGKISLDNYPNVLAWIERVKHLPGFVGMIGIVEPVAVCYT